MTTTKIALTLDSADIQGNLFGYGGVRIEPSMRIPDVADDLLLEQVSAKAKFTGDGAPVVDLFPNDSIGPQQDDGSPGWSYTIYYDQCPGDPSPWSFYLTTDAGLEQRLSALAETPVAQAGQQYSPKASGIPAAGQIQIATGVGQNTEWADLPDGDNPGTVTSVSVATANGFSGEVAEDSTTPEITLKANVTASVLKSDGTSLLGAEAGTDYLAPDGDGSQLTGITGDKYYTQPFSAVSEVSVQHNLGKRPAVTVEDSAGSVVEGDVVYTDVNNLTLTFSAAFSGTVTCN